MDNTNIKAPKLNISNIKSPLSGGGFSLGNVGQEGNSKTRTLARIVGKNRISINSLIKSQETQDRKITILKNIVQNIQKNVVKNIQNIQKNVVKNIQNIQKDVVQNVQKNIVEDNQKNIVQNNILQNVQKNIVQNNIVQNVQKNIVGNKIKINAIEKSQKIQDEKITILKNISQNTQSNIGQKLPDSGGSNIENTLVETNNILIQIQKQLSLDFAMRIADEKEKNKALKQGQSRKRLKAEESALEKSTKKIGKGIGKVVDKVISPVKNFFSDLLDFLLTVGAGIAVNAAFEWLSKKENREQLDEWFGWVAKNWKWVAAAIVGVLALQPILNIVGAIGGAIVTIRAALDIFGWARKKLFGGGRPPVPPSNKPGSQSGGQSGNAGGRMSGGSNTGLYYGRNTNPVTGQQLRSSGSISRYNASMARDIQGKANIGDKARLFFRNNNIRLPKINKLPNLKGVPRAGALSAVFAGLDYFNRKDTGQTETQAISGAASGAVGGMAGFSLASGVAAKALSPLLVTPIPGSRLLYGALVLGAGIYGGMKGNELFGKVSDKVTGVEARAMGGPITAGKPYLVGEGGPELVVPKISGTVINNMKTEKIYQMISSDIGEGKINMIELPPITNQLPPPEIPVPSGPATEVPEVSSVNLADPYRQLTPMLYGITV